MAKKPNTQQPSLLGNKTSYIAPPQPLQPAQTAPAQPAQITPTQAPTQPKTETPKEGAPVAQETTAQAAQVAPVTQPPVVETHLAKAEETQAIGRVADGDVFANLGISEEMEAQLAEMDPGLDSSDCKVPYIVFNLQKEFTSADGQVYKSRRDQFVNTQTDEVKDKVQVVLMYRLKTNEWAYYDQTENKKIRVCVSSDQRFGEMQMDMGDLKQGSRRKCQKCPQASWRTAEDPKTRKPVKILDCAEIQNFILIEHENMAPGMMRFKRSSAGAAKDMVAKFIQGKRRVVDAKTGISKPSDYPWFTFVFEISLKMDPGNKYSIPEFKLLRPINKEELPVYLAQAQFLKKYMSDAMRIADKTDEELARDHAAENENFDARRLESGDGDGGDAPVSEPGKTEIVGTEVNF